MNRRTFLAAAGATIVGSGTTPKVLHHLQDAHDAPGDADTRDAAWPLRSITYNVLACRGFMGAESDREILRRKAPQIPARTALELALYDPDLITFQESPAESVSAEIAQMLNMKYTYFPGGFPGTVLTKHEIIESTNCPVAGEPHARDMFTRHWGKAVLKTPAGELTVYTAHLYPGGGDGQAIRVREVRAMLAAMRADLESDRSVILQGDLNLDTNNELYPLFAEAGLRDAFEEKGTGQEFTGTSVNPWWRVDFIMSKGPIADRLTECRVLYEGAFRTYAEDPTSVALSDHLPVLAVFE